MRIFVMTLFPDMVKAALNESILKRAQENGYLELYIYNIRDYSANKHKKVDDYPYGGGAGMVMTVQPVVDTYRTICEEHSLCENHEVIYMSPKGDTLNQGIVKEFSKLDDIVILCGHYEGIDQRAIDMIVTREISIGDYVLTGGELGAMVLIDSVSRLIPGVLGRNESFEEESFEDNLLEYPQFTRPPEYEGKKVPDVLLSGNHSKIDDWRKEQSLKITKERRMDLYKKYCNNHENEV